MDRSGNADHGRSVEPVEARVHDNDPDAVRVREGDERMSGEARTPVVGASSGRDANIVERRDSARWGPIWAGLITAITTFLLLELLAFGTGLLTPNVAPGPDSTASAWISGIIGLIAFFTGGSVAGMTSSVRGASTGLLNGFLVWALGTVLILVLSVFGLGQIFGTLGNLVGQIGAIQAVNLPNPTVDPQQLLDTVRTAAMTAFLGLLISALASALGGFLGGRTNHPIGHMADRT